MEANPTGTLSITLRDETEEDDAFLREVYASTRATELALVPWSDEQKNAFLNMQFDAQRSHYRAQYPDASYLVIRNNGERVGRLYVNRGEEIRILDIVVLPQYSRSGIGTTLIRELLEEGAQTGKSVSVWVEVFNPSLALFERLGFSRVEDDGFNCLLALPAPPQKIPD